MQEGDIAPDFELQASDGNLVKLSNYRGKNVILCFYPKNHLFACPSKKVFKMAQAIVSAYPEISALGAALFSISVDTVEDQKKFVDEYRIPYLHLSDSKKETCKAYAGLNIAGLAKRSTFIINKEGKIAKIFLDIKVEIHGKEIIEALKSLK
ncbi:MAG TPA: peroxiredoxin [Nitrosopumilaceae archaeon]|nr:peroxiredoxin [Nitrosopumilaceae archaeon]